MSSMGVSTLRPYQFFQGDILISAADANTLTDGGNVARQWMLQALADPDVVDGVGLFVAMVPWDRGETDISLTTFGIDPFRADFLAPEIAADIDVLQVRDAAILDRLARGLTQDEAAAIRQQTPLSFERLFRSAGLDLGEYLAAQSITRLAILLLVSFIVVMTVLAVLSVFASIATYYRFRIHRSGDSFTVRRGLFNRHEMHVRKSRIQLVHYSQDWLDFLLGRRDVVFEQISHAAPGAGAAAAQQTSRTLVPSVALRDTRRLVDEIVPGVDVDRLAFTPVSKLYFYKHVVITTLLYAIAGIAMLLQDFTPMRLVLLLWPFHLALVYLRWRRAGLAVHGESIVARSGAIGINYHIVPAFKIQQARHLQRHHQRTVAQEKRVLVRQPCIGEAVGRAGFLRVPRGSSEPLGHVRRPSSGQVFTPSTNPAAWV